MPQAQKYPMPSLVGGISEQAPQSRGVSNAEDQWNCVNSIKTGAEARAGSKTLKVHSVSFNDPFEHEIRRNKSEHYKILIENGVIEIFNLIDGTRCTKTSEAAISAYLAHTGPARAAFRAVTVEDTTFIINRQKTVLMGATKSAKRPNKAIFYFKAGNYSTTYTASITYGGTTYSATYTTPDNSTSSNAQYITTTSLAASLAAAITSNILPSLPAGSTAVVSGSTVIITVPDPNDFSVSSEDGANNTNLISIKDYVRKFSDLPDKAPTGYKVGVRSAADTKKDEYWLEYIGSGSSGYWQEIVKPDTAIGLNATTMPHVMTNTALNTFGFAAGSWGSRLAGDGVNTARDPNFVGKKIVSAQFISGRLGLFTSGSYMLSRSRNAFSFFPDTAQTRLDTDPVGYDVATGTSTNILDSIAISDKLFMWSDGSQLRVDSGDDQIKEETIDCRPSSNYEYDGDVSPKAVGLSSAVFGTGQGEATRLVEVIYQRGTPVGQIPLNDHCPELVQGTLRGIHLGGTSPILLATTDTSGPVAYVYQWFNDGDQRVLSSWGRWSFPAADKVISASVRGSDIYLILMINGKLAIETLPLRRIKSDGIQLRLDHVITETAPKSFTAGVGLQVTLPYIIPEARRSRFKALESQHSPETTYRGRTIEFEWVDGSTILLKTEDAALKFVFGATVEAKRRFSQPYVQLKDGPLLPSRLLIGDIVVSHADSSEYRVEVRDRDNSLLKSFEYTARRLPRADVINNAVPVETGEFKSDIGRISQEVWIDLVNDSPFPSSWVSADLYYNPGK
ncbi:hypothetical protein IB276_22490 [Ensifer sp. ENS04]|uniref:phage nozzle protein n=1 Tax=Ensifer sp. ENS04 TaxID=2769281 RepID=UPI00177A98B2|nr:hypothetical protein [Ensifer sp. ENS04]MBD9542217.1 hypothetical protein [Ensifer sp. ENS04]